MLNLRSFVVTSTILLVTACAAKQLPQQQLMDTQGAITSAEELDGDENPKAKLHLQFAREQLVTARQLIDEGDDEEAMRMLDRATADADLALTLARTEQLRKESVEARTEVEELRTDDAAKAPPTATTASVK
jgi:glycerol-3-phosphate dehydrogenase